MFQLTDKTALVTGATGGIGRAIVETLHRLGATIAITDINREALDAFAAQLGSRVFVFEANLTDAASLKALVKDAEAQMGKIDILVNNAGTIRREDSVNFSEKDWDDVINVNLKSLFFLTQACGKHFIAQKSGKVINVASMLSFQGGIRVPSYTAAKSGVKGITMTLANEWAKFGVNVNSIAPGYMSTNNTAAIRADKDRNEAILDRIPQGRWGSPDDMKGAVVFLASKASDYVNGFTLAVDGGWLGR